jgi:hypothetical protein
MICVKPHQGTMVLGLKDKLIYGVISGLIPLLELCTTVGTIHVKRRWYQVISLSLVAGNKITN